MPQNESGQVILKNLHEHPAVRAWLELGPAHREPSAIQVLKERKTDRPDKSAVYRLVGVGHGGSAVVAKRCRATRAVLERTIYEQILPQLPLSRLRFYGFHQESEGGVCWLFLEEARGEAYCPLTTEHRVAAGRWLGSLHIAGQRIEAAATLPDRGSNYHRDHMRVGWEAIQENLANPALSMEDRSVLSGILSLYEQLDREWQQLEALCDLMPSTFVHGDLVGKNIRLGEKAQGMTLRVFDWEYAGWGTPATDLAQAHQGAPGLSASPDLHAYRVALGKAWPDVGPKTIERLAPVATVFRLLAAIDWASRGLRSDWVERTMRHLTIYESGLSVLVRTVPWSR